MRHLKNRHFFFFLWTNIAKCKISWKEWNCNHNKEKAKFDKSDTNQVGVGLMELASPWQGWDQDHKLSHKALLPSTNSSRVVISNSTSPDCLNMHRLRSIFQGTLAQWIGQPDRLYCTWIEVSVSIHHHQNWAPKTCEEKKNKAKKQKTKRLHELPNSEKRRHVSGAHLLCLQELGLCWALLEGRKKKRGNKLQNLISLMTWNITCNRYTCFICFWVLTRQHKSQSHLDAKNQWHLTHSWTQALSILCDSRMQQKRLAPR